MSAEKYLQTEKFFAIRVTNRKEHGRKATAIVQTFNAEADPERPDVSWSAGFTHFRVTDSADERVIRTGAVSHCGVQWFEENAQEVSGPVLLPSVATVRRVKLARPVRLRKG
jgi:hypothetical protein